MQYGTEAVPCLSPDMAQAFSPTKIAAGGLDNSYTEGQRPPGHPFREGGGGGGDGMGSGEGRGSLGRHLSEAQLQGEESFDALRHLDANAPVRPLHFYMYTFTCTLLHVHFYMYTYVCINSKFNIYRVRTFYLYICIQVKAIVQIYTCLSLSLSIYLQHNPLAAVPAPIHPLTPFHPAPACECHYRGSFRTANRFGYSVLRPDQERVMHTSHSLHSSCTLSIAKRHISALFSILPLLYSLNTKK